MSRLVAEVVSEAIDRAGKALALATKIQPLIGRSYADRTVSAWGRGDVMPPADVVFAAAQATGVSLDERLGIGREPNETERELLELRQAVENVPEQLLAQTDVLKRQAAEIQDLREQLGDLRRQSGDLYTQVIELFTRMGLPYPAVRAPERPARSRRDETAQDSQAG